MSDRNSAYWVQPVGHVRPDESGVILAIERAQIIDHGWKATVF